MAMTTTSTHTSTEPSAAGSRGPGCRSSCRCFNEAAGLAAPARAARRCLPRPLRAARGLACEVVYVDDGSRDNTLAVARELPADRLDVQVVSLSRNFGKEAALLAGLDHARCGAVLFMDGDGQHPPT